jgi:Domain of unknown function (DUF4129)
VLYLAGISVFEPLLVAGGFGLYVNRRVFLEGWEIELAFRALAARCRSGANRHRFAAAAGVILLSLGAASVHADVCVPGDPASAAACIAEVRAEPDFGGVRKVTRWLPKQPDWSGANGPDLDWLAPFFEFVARSGEVMLWGALALVLAVLLFSLRGVPGSRRRDRPPGLPRTFMGLDLDPSRLPRDVVSEARAHWRRGDRVAALSLLYRGALVRLSERGALEIPASATEHECVRMVQRTRSGAAADAFDALTGSWVRARYAHEPPGDEQFESLCIGFTALEESP